jgi:hypothetical protein
MPPTLSEDYLKSPFFKGGFRGIIKGLFIIPPGPPLEKGGISLHDNAVKVGLVDIAEDWVYFNARSYLSNAGILEIDVLDLEGKAGLWRTIAFQSRSLGTRKITI